MRSMPCSLLILLTTQRLFRPASNLFAAKTVADFFAFALLTVHIIFCLQLLFKPADASHRPWTNCKLPWLLVRRFLPPRRGIRLLILLLRRFLQSATKNVLRTLFPTSLRRSRKRSPKRLRQSQVQARTLPCIWNRWLQHSKISRIQFLIFFVKTKKKTPRTKHILLDIKVAGLPK